MEHTYEGAGYKLSAEEYLAMADAAEGLVEPRTLDTFRGLVARVVAPGRAFRSSRERAFFKQLVTRISRAAGAVTEGALAEGSAEDRLRKLMAKVKAEYGFTKRRDIPHETRVWLQRGMRFVNEGRALEKRFKAMRGGPVPRSFFREAYDLLKRHEGTLLEFAKHMEWDEWPSWMQYGLGAELRSAWGRSIYGERTRHENSYRYVLKAARSLTMVGRGTKEWSRDTQDSVNVQMAIPKIVFDRALVPHSETAPPAAPGIEDARKRLFAAFRHVMRVKYKGEYFGVVMDFTRDMYKYLFEKFIPHVTAQLEHEIESAKGGAKRSAKNVLNKFLEWKDSLEDSMRKYRKGLHIEVGGEGVIDDIPYTEAAKFFHVEEGAFTSIGFTQFRIAIEMKVDFFQTIWAFAKEEVRAQKPELEKLRKAGEIGDLVEQIGRVGEWRLIVYVEQENVRRLPHGGIPKPSVNFFHDACKVAWKLMTDDVSKRGLGIHPSKLAGFIGITFEKDRGAAGWYRRSDDLIAVNIDLSLSTNGGMTPDLHYGSLPQSNMVWTIVHEMGHRVWYRGLGSLGRKTFSEFINSQGKSIRRETRLGMAKRAEASYRALGGGRRKYNVASHIKVHRDEVILSHKAMGGAMRALADVWWWWFRDQKPFGRDKDRPHHFYKWLGDKRLTRMLPTDYAGATPSEAFPEILASLVLRYHGWKTGMGRSIGDQSTHPFIAAVVRTVLRPVQREDEEDVGLEGGPDVIVLGERKVEDAVRRFYGGAAHARVVRLGGRAPWTVGRG